METLCGLLQDQGAPVCLVPSQYASMGHTEHFGPWPEEGEDWKQGIAADSRVLVAETWEALSPFPRGSPTSTQKHSCARGQSQTLRAVPVLQNSYFIIKEPWNTPEAAGLSSHQPQGWICTGGQETALEHLSLRNTEDKGNGRVRPG